MAAHLSIGRNLSVSLVALASLALVTVAVYVLSRPGPEVQPMPGFESNAAASQSLVEPSSPPQNMGPIPDPSPRAANAESRAGRIARLFEKGFEINFEREASVYSTTRNIPENDRLLKTYGTEPPNGDAVRPRASEAAVPPGLPGIAAQARRHQWRGQEKGSFTLANAMRDAIWRKNTAAKLETLISQHRPLCTNDSETSATTSRKGC